MLNKPVIFAHVILAFFVYLKTPVNVLGFQHMEQLEKQTLNQASYNLLCF